MPFDPTLPADGTKASAAQMRAQLNGLKDLIDAVPAGPPGAQGPPGASGTNGADGPQGPPFAQVIVDGTVTLDAGSNASVSASFDGNNVHLSFGIPRGADGSQGPPGNVSVGDLNNAVAGTSSNSNGVATLSAPFTNDPPTLADIETLREKLNELIAALRR